MNIAKNTRQFLVWNDYSFGQISALPIKQMNLILLNGLRNLQQIKLVVCWKRNIRQCPTFSRKKLNSFPIKHSSLS